MLVLKYLGTLSPVSCRLSTMESEIQHESLSIGLWLNMEPLKDMFGDPSARNHKSQVQHTREPSRVKRPGDEEQAPKPKP